MLRDEQSRKSTCKKTGRGNLQREMRARLLLEEEAVFEAERWYIGV